MKFTTTQCFLIAQALATTRPKFHTKSMEQWEETVDAIADMLRVDNQNFDSDMFYVTCDIIKNSDFNVLNQR
jgi:hypothetical protein